MGTYAQQQIAGEGKFRARVVIEGWGSIIVDHSSLVRTLSDGREQILGLDPRTLRIAARVDLARANLREQEMTLEIADDDDHDVLAAFFRVPGARTQLTADLSAAATSMTVADTAAFPSSGVVHLRTEAIAYSGKTSTSFTGLTRGYWNTIAQAHYTGDGAKKLFPEVTDRPRSLYGRRVFVYLYGKADSATSNGTLRWRGVARSDVSYDGKGVVSFTVSPLSWLLEQQIGGDLEEPIPIRGIYYPATYAYQITLVRWSGASQSGTSAPTSDAATITFSGFYADNAAFCDDLTSRIATATSGWSWAEAKLVAQPLGPDGYQLVYRTGNSTVYYLEVMGAYHHPPSGEVVGPSIVDVFDQADGVRAPWIGESGGITHTLVDSSFYRITIHAPTPRAVTGGVSGRGVTDPTAPDNTQDRIYLGGNVVPSTNLQVTIKTDAGSEETLWTPVRSVDTTNRTIDVRSMNVTVLGPQTEIRVLRVLTTGSVLDLLSYLETNSPTLANSGASPLIGPDDFDLDFDDEVLAAIADLGLGARRTYACVEGIPLGEILEHELRLIGCYLAPNDTGQLRIRRLTLALPTDAATIEINSSVLKGGDPPATSRNPDELLGEVLIEQGWDFREQEHKGLTIRVRDVSSPTHLGGVLTIAPKSAGSAGGFVNVGFYLEVQPEEAFLLASAVLGIFGAEYTIVSAAVGIEVSHMALGSAVLLTSAFVPNASTGGLGVSQKVYLPVGYDWSPFTGEGRIELLGHDRRIAGYAPAFLVASQVDNGGNSWTITLTTTAYTSSAVSTWFTAGDEVRVVQRDTATPTRVSGTVTAVSDSPKTLTVTFDGAWTPGANTWSIGYDRAPSVDTAANGSKRWAQTAFGFVAGTDRRIGFTGGDVDGYDFAP